MFSENLKALRKARGMTQEELAARLHVVRQTVSKWEKGLSVPDAELLIRLAEVLDTTVGQLLGADIPEDGESRNDLADQLARINEQLAIRNRRGRLSSGWYWASWPPLWWSISCSWYSAMARFNLSRTRWIP